ncbi:MAG: hypothetical protein IIB37_14945 [Gemmatimonadetes bacterium]|nr:hypothetical protein [Gemmatimonadota bacterium]
MREGIVGFTLGELGILISFLLLFVVADQRRSSTTVSVERTDSLEGQLDRAKDSVNVEVARANLLQRNLALAEDSLEILRGKRSAQTPSCREVGVAVGFLFSVEVLSADLYRIASDTMNYGQLLSRFSEPLSRAERENCVHQVTSYAGPDISGGAMVEAQRRLEADFYHSVRSVR